MFTWESEIRYGPRRLFGVEDLLSMMDEPFTVFGEKRRVDKAFVMPRPGVTILFDRSFEEQHRDVIEAVDKYPDRLIGNFMRNPRLGLDEGLSTLKKLVDSRRFGMVKLHPTLHNYWPQAKEFTYPILEEAASLGIPVLIHTGEPPYSVPALLDPVARDHPNVNIIIAHFGIQFVAFSADAINVARHNPNVYLETGWGPLPRLAEAIDVLGPERLVFGSDSPPQDIYSQLRVVECLNRKPPIGVGLAEEDVYEILGGNLMRLANVG